MIQRGKEEGCLTFITTLLTGLGILIAIFAIIPALGCEGLKTSWGATMATGFGSDWLVVQYSQNGDVINYWELKDKSVKNEGQSDGIYFLDNSGNVIHLSGHYAYVQVQNWTDARKKLLKRGRTEQ